MTTSAEHEHGHEHHLNIKIIVNGREKHVAERDLTYDEIVRLAYENPPSGENVLITVTYRRGHDPRSEGSVKPGGHVRVKEGMVFNVKHTDKS